MAAKAPEEEYGGYDYEFVETVPDRFICNICTKAQRDPHLTVCCGQHFCQSCLENWLKKYGKKSCPHCREEDFNHFLNKEKKREIRELKIRCTLRQEGCQWVGELDSLQTHLNSDRGCGYVEVSCTNKCGEKLKRKDLKSHLTNRCFLSSRSLPVVNPGHHNPSTTIRCAPPPPPTRSPDRWRSTSLNRQSRPLPPPPPLRNSFHEESIHSVKRPGPPPPPVRMTLPTPPPVPIRITGQSEHPMFRVPPFSQDYVNIVMEDGQLPLPPRSPSALGHLRRRQIASDELYARELQAQFDREAPPPLPFPIRRTDLSERPMLRVPPPLPYSGGRSPPPPLLHRNLSSHSTEEDFESRFDFRSDIPRPELWRHGPKTYPSANARNRIRTGGRRMPPLVPGGDIKRQPPPPPPTRRRMPPLAPGWDIKRNVPPPPPTREVPPHPSARKAPRLLPLPPRSPSAPGDLRSRQIASDELYARELQAQFDHEASTL